MLVNPKVTLSLVE